jgi:O-antigen/teichoic acid export membrane protein
MPALQSRETTTSAKTLAIRGVVLNWAARAWVVLVAFFVTPVLIHQLGDETYGIWAIVLSLGSYYALADLGVRDGVITHLARFEARREPAARDGAGRASLAIYSVLASLVLAAGALAAWLVPRLFATAGPLDAATVRWTVLLMSAAAALDIFGYVFDSALRARQRFDAINGIAVVAETLRSGLLIAIARAGGGLPALAAATLAVALLAQLARAWAAMRGADGLRFRTRPEPGTVWLLTGFSALNSLLGLARRVVWYGGPLVIGLMLGPAAVTCYAIASSLARKTQELSKGVSAVLVPLSSRLAAEERGRELARVAVEAPRLLLALHLSATALLVVFGRRFIALWIGPEHAAESYPILCVLMAAIAVSMVSGGLSSILVGLARYRLLAVAHTSGAAATLVLAAWFVPALGPIGFAWAVLLPRIAVDGIALPASTVRSLGVTPARYTSGAVLRGALAALPPAAAALALESLLPAPGMPLLLVEMAAVGGLACASTFLVCFDAARRADVARALRLRTAGSRPLVPPVGP